MQNNPYCLFKTSYHKSIISTLAIVSLLLIVSGCDNTIKNNKPAAVTGVIISDIANTSTNVTTHSQPIIDNQATSAEVVNTIVTPEGIATVIAANNQFAFAMYQQINSQPGQADNNVFFSPYSLSTAMAMLYAATEGETRRQIQKTFYYPSTDILNVNSTALYKQFNKANPDYRLAVINELWIQQGLTPNKTYIDTVQRYYGGQVTAVDFESNPNPSRQTINKKIAQQTQQMIPDLLPVGSIQSDTAVVLTNAIYFKGDWQTPFTAQSTSAQPFYNQMGRASKVKMMQLKSYFDYAEDKQVQVVQLPYKGDDLSMLVILPKLKDKTTMQQLVQNLSATKIKQWSADLARQEVRIYLPKFKLEERYQMKTLLADMGMPRAFQNGAEFNLYADGPPIKLDDVYHQAVVTVDEKGTEAAAATAIVGMYTGMSYPIEFKADHPFIFIIKDNKTDAILFFGQVNKP